ncbi:MAG: DNA-binding protein [Myxococcales bacterium]|nr:DNA-binding protein [Myxococcales bacterium]
MAQLIVRNLEEKLVRRLRERAARSGRSAEEEHREILRSTLLAVPKKTFKEALLEMPDVGDDALFERPRDLGRKVKL